MKYKRIIVLNNTHFYIRGVNIIWTYFIIFIDEKFNSSGIVCNDIYEKVTKCLTSIKLILFHYPYNKLSSYKPTKDKEYAFIANTPVKVLFFIDYYYKKAINLCLKKISEHINLHGKILVYLFFLLFSVSSANVVVCVLITSFDFSVSSMYCSVYFSGLFSRFLQYCINLGIGMDVFPSGIVLTDNFLASNVGGNLQHTQF